MKKLFLLIPILFLSGCAVSSQPVMQNYVDKQSGIVVTTTLKQDLIRNQEKVVTSQVYIDAKDDLEYNDAVKNFGLDIQYGDVTGDNQEEALVSIPSGGTAGITAVLVYGLDGEKVKLLQRIDGYKMVARAKNGNLEVAESSPESSSADLVIYAWNGKNFVIKSSNSIPSTIKY